MSRLTAADYKSVQRAGEILHARGWRAVFSPNQMTEAWSQLIDRIAEGYEDSADEYANDLACRDWLAEAWPLFTPGVRAARRPELDSLDARFRAVTTETTETALSKYGLHDHDRWWWHRRPSLLIGELARDHILPPVKSAETDEFGEQPWSTPTEAVDLGGAHMSAQPLPPVVDAETWRRDLAELRAREKAATRELDAIAAQRRRMPMVEMPEYTLEGENGPVTLAEIFDGKSQLIVYNHMWFPGETWQCQGCTGYTSQFARLEYLDAYDARFVIVTQGPIDEALAYKKRVGNKMTWYSTANSPFGTDVDAPPGGAFAINVFLRDGNTVYRTWHTTGRGTEQLSYTFSLTDILPYGRQEEWQDSPEGWPQSPTYSRWPSSQQVAAFYGEEA